MDEGRPSHPTIKEGDHYYIEDWRGNNNYCCIKCQYSTLWFSKLLKHITAGRHRWPFPKPVDAQPVKDRWGDPVY